MCKALGCFIDALQAKYDKDMACDIKKDDIIDKKRENVSGKTDEEEKQQDIKITVDDGKPEEDDPPKKPEEPEEPEKEDPP